MPQRPGPRAATPAGDGGPTEADASFWQVGPAQAANGAGDSWERPAPAEAPEWCRLARWALVSCALAVAMADVRKRFKAVEAVVESEIAMVKATAQECLDRAEQLGEARKEPEPEGAATSQFGIGNNDSSDEPMWLQMRDVIKYPFAGMLSPCLMQAEGEPLQPRRRQFMSCAVVGAAPNLRGSRAGADIDSNGAVFRAGLCKRAQLQEFRDDAGQKTTFCVSFQLQTGLPTGARSVLPLKSWKWLSQFEKMDWNTCRKNILVMHPAWLKRCDQMLDALGEVEPKPAHSVSYWRNTSIFNDPNCTIVVQRGTMITKEERLSCPAIVNLSAGFMAILAAMELCEKITLYGFDTNTSEHAKYAHFSAKHKVEKNRTEVDDHPHAFPLERHLMKLWHARGEVKFHNSMLRTVPVQDPRPKPREPGGGAGRALPARHSAR